MSVQYWSDDFVSGIKYIDEQHKHLFNLVNQFEDEYDERIKQDDAIAFLNRLWDYCEVHFLQEEILMADTHYPLMDYHTDKHKQLKHSVKKIIGMIKNNKISDTYNTIIKFTILWLNDHIGVDDLTFFNFNRHKNYRLDIGFIGRYCEILSLDNQVLGTGRINAIQNNSIEIQNSSDVKIPVNLYDFVKVSFYSSENELQIFIATVYYSTRKVLKLFNATIIKAENKRMFVRINTKIGAVISRDGKRFPVTIMDISAGGIRVNSTYLLDLHAEVDVEFTILNTNIKLKSKLVRAVKNIDGTNTYAFYFIDIENNPAQDKLMTYVLFKQSEIRKSIAGD